MNGQLYMLVRWGFVVSAFFAAGCVTEQVKQAHSVDLVVASETVPEPQLLDVAVVVLEPGVPDGEIDPEVAEELLKKRVFTNIRRAESRYLAVKLQRTITNSGYWGAVRATPTESLASDVNVKGEILQSDGDRFRLHIKAHDAIGRQWIDRVYDMETAASAYDPRKYPDKDPYQDVFNSIANDLAAARDKLTSDELANIRSVAQLRFAGDLSPDSFGEHLAQNGKGRYEIQRLPAYGDPMFDRALRVREREYLFIDTLNDHYDNFYRDIDEPYGSWRRYAREEAVAFREVNAEKRRRYIMGGLTILATILYSRSDDGSLSDRVITNAGLYGGMEMIKAGIVRGQEARLHAATLEELSNGFEDEVTPVVVEMEGTAYRLTGNAQAQYEEWQRLLRDLYAAEIGFVGDTAIEIEPELDMAAKQVEIVDPEAESAEENETDGDTVGQPSE
jgi:hypothetical protein